MTRRKFHPVPGSSGWGWNWKTQGWRGKRTPQFRSSTYLNEGVHREHAPAHTLARSRPLPERVELRNRRACLRLAVPEFHPPVSLS